MDKVSSALYGSKMRLLFVVLWCGRLLAAPVPVANGESPPTTPLINDSSAELIFHFLSSPKAIELEPPRGDSEGALHRYHSSYYQGGKASQGSYDPSKVACHFWFDATKKTLDPNANDHRVGVGSIFSSIDRGRGGEVPTHHLSLPIVTEEYHGDVVCRVTRSEAKPITLVELREALPKQVEVEAREVRQFPNFARYHVPKKVRCTAFMGRSGDKEDRVKPFILDLKSVENDQFEKQNLFSEATIELDDVYGMVVQANVGHAVVPGKGWDHLYVNAIATKKVRDKTKVVGEVLSGFGKKVRFDLVEKGHISIWEMWRESVSITSTEAIEAVLAGPDGGKKYFSNGRFSLGKAEQDGLVPKGVATYFLLYCNIIGAPHFIP